MPYALEDHALVCVLKQKKRFSNSNRAGMAKVHSIHIIHVVAKIAVQAMMQIAAIALEKKSHQFSVFEQSLFLMHIVILCVCFQINPFELHSEKNIVL